MTGLPTPASAMRSSAWSVSGDTTFGPADGGGGLSEPIPFSASVQGGNRLFLAGISDEETDGFRSGTPPSYRSDHLCGYGKMRHARPESFRSNVPEILWGNAAGVSEEISSDTKHLR